MGGARGARNSDRLRWRQQEITSQRGACEIARVQAQVLAQRGVPRASIAWVGLSYRQRAALAIDGGGDRTWMTDGSMR
jgi:hypothetical protein